MIKQKLFITAVMALVASPVFETGASAQIVLTMEQALEMKKRFEIEDRNNPWTRGETRFYIKPAR